MLNIVPAARRVASKRSARTTVGCSVLRRGCASKPPRVVLDATLQGNRVLGLLPPAAIPYFQLVRLDRPIGTYLLAWPGMWSIALAADMGHLPDARLLTTFAIGSVVMRGAGCTINDLWDREIDAKVERTRNRPLACGAITPRQGIIFLGAQLSVGLGVLMNLNYYSIGLGASSLLLVATYPLMKRVTYWPQLFLGFTFNWGALLGWAAVHGSCDWNVVLPLYLGGVNWTLFYDTIYAHQDKDDDVTAGVKSTALLLGDNSKPWLAAFGASSIGLLAMSGIAAEQTYPFYMGVAAAGSHLAWQLHSVNLNDPTDCLEKFKSNKWFGGIVFGGIVAGNLIG